MIVKTIKQMYMSRKEWEEKKDSILAYDHPSTDALMICVNEGDHDWYYYVFNINARDERNEDLVYEGDEYPEAIDHAEGC